MRTITEVPDEETRHRARLHEMRAESRQGAVWLHPRAFEPEFSTSRGRDSVRRISTDHMELERFRVPGRRVVATATASEVVPGVWTTGEIPRITDYEDVGGAFFLDGATRYPDPLVDDQAVFFDTEDGLVVVLGCAHAGVVNTLLHVSRTCRSRRVHAVLGGMHLGNASEMRVRRTIDALREMRVALVVPLHCSGFVARCAFSTAFGAGCEYAACGSGWRFASVPGIRANRPVRSTAP
ncbi:MBL fold metallo-hydrolase [Congregicoccus parvus]|uniref:MBL fold metallo-hydrolase n=1 Tax=Congregicoccus parvus TaxID=3081749 RepID=UPI003FA600A5